MKTFRARLATLSLALLTFSPLAHAQDLPAIWSGLYLGAHAGGIGISHDAKSTLGGNVAQSSSSGGGVAGVYGGYNFQKGPWVAGAELDGTWGCRDMPIPLVTAQLPAT